MFYLFSTSELQSIYLMRKLLGIALSHQVTKSLRMSKLNIKDYLQSKLPHSRLVFVTRAHIILDKFC